jgi:hypothetical protein
MRTVLPVTILAIAFCSCELGTYGVNRTVCDARDLPGKTRAASQSDTVFIDYNKNKELLQILCLLPDSSMASWRWKAGERRDFVDSIKENGFIVDTSKNVLNLRKITPHYFDYQVVDGTWKLATYARKNHEKLVITDDVTQGHDIHVFSYDGKTLCAHRNFMQLILRQLLVDTANVEYAKLIDEEFPQYEYDFSKEGELTVFMSSYGKPNYGKCFKGNKATFEINGEFRLTDSRWGEVPAAE